MSKQEMPVTEEEDRAWNEMMKNNPKWAESVPEGVQTHKQIRYLDSQGRDWIDECAATMTVDEFRGAMKFTIGKYLRRAGKKDEIRQEIGKVRDYACRWLEYEGRNHG